MEKQALKNIIGKALQRDSRIKDIRRVRLFGSFKRGTSRQNSDIDLLVEFSPEARIGLFELIRIQNDLEAATNREIDLVTPNQLSPYFRDQVMKEAEIIYEG
ncbi:MAG: nucleotidyltransferase family protein [Patescibacteria group bacterium]